MYWVTISKSCMQWVVCKLFFSPDKWRDWVNIKYGLIGLTSCIWVVISSSKFKILNYHIFQKETPKLKRNNTIFFFWKEINNHYIEKKEREKFFHRTWKKSITLIDVLNLKKFKCILKRLDNMSTFTFSGYYFSFYFFVFVRLRNRYFSSCEDRLLTRQKSVTVGHLQWLHSTVQKIARGDLYWKFTRNDKGSFCLFCKSISNIDEWLGKKHYLTNSDKLNIFFY